MSEALCQTDHIDGPVKYVTCEQCGRVEPLCRDCGFDIYGHWPCDEPPPPTREPIRLTDEAEEAWGEWGRNSEWRSASGGYMGPKFLEDVFKAGFAAGVAAGVDEANRVSHESYGRLGLSIDRAVLPKTEGADDGQ